MDKLEKVIRGLEWCMNEKHDCYREKGCPYENEGEDIGCKYALHRDALALLKAQEPQYPVCERCGKQIDHINTSVFNYDGSDSPSSLRITYEKQSECVVFSTTPNWTGYELSDEERKDDIRCPYCGRYPFDADVEIEFHEPVEVMMWTSRPTDEQREGTPWE